ncbi:K(+)-transporting ATPase subunit C [Staphylococcus capitis]|uniref:K(+)-transporting ATPase subunit C n=1 Tax=Staphylococcus capitis TaxID=29388 RepID=UPI0030C4F9E3
MATIRKSVGLVVVLFVLCGFIFPLTVTAIGQVAFPYQANGSLIKQDGKVIGSELIGQQWNDSKYFHGRISAVNYNMDKKLLKANGGPSSGGSNLANSNPQFKQRVEDSIHKEGHHLTTASGSGLDPDITVSNANAQAKRIANERGIEEATIQRMIQQYKQSSPMTEDYVNVLKMNIALDKMK